MQLGSNPDFMHCDFEMFSRLWRSIESCIWHLGYEKNMQERSVYELSLNIKLVRIFSSGTYSGDVEIEKSPITLNYAMGAERIYKNAPPYKWQTF